jgi:exopolyphosphatase / guanosine-5'-triphosphate,3'-diphosphate pyrophosphatase
MPKVAVIDTGSNAIRLAIAKDKGNDFEVLFKHREPIRLGADVFSDGKISTPLLNETILAFKRFKKIADEHKCDVIKAIATSAMRDAKNQKEVLKRIADESGIVLEVISGDRESELVFKAIRHEMDLKKDNALLIDIGGGSVELVAVHKGDILKGKSFPLGTVRLLSTMKNNVDAYYNQIKSIEPLLKDALSYIRELKIDFDFCVGIGGNIERMGKVNCLIADTEDPSQVQLQDLIKMYDVLMPFSLGKRMKMFDLKSDQADVIMPAIVLCIYFLQTAFCQDLRIPGVGIKDGVILEELRLLR